MKVCAKCRTLGGMNIEGTEVEQTYSTSSLVVQTEDIRYQKRMEKRVRIMFCWL